jgi:hypothetical protein
MLNAMASKPTVSELFGPKLLAREIVPYESSPSLLRTLATKVFLTPVAIPIIVNGFISD